MDRSVTGGRRREESVIGCGMRQVLRVMDMLIECKIPVVVYRYWEGGLTTLVGPEAMARFIRDSEWW